MTNKEKYDNIFVEVFGVEPTEDFSKENASNWDSVHQLSVVAMIEEAFDLMLDPEDIMAMTSYAAGRDILSKNGIEI